MSNLSQRVDKFIDIFIDQNGYVRVVEGLQNTLLIAVLGLLIGIVIGTLIATVRVVPKYKLLPRVSTVSAASMWRCSEEARWSSSSWSAIMYCCRCWA